MDKIQNFLSYIFILLSLILSFSKVFGSDALYLQIALLGVLINALVTFYDSQSGRIPNEDFNKVRRLAKMYIPTLITTQLFFDNAILEDYWNYAPLAITTLLLLANSMNDDARTRCNVNCSWVALNFLAQTYAAIKTNDIAIGIEALLVLMAHLCTPSTDDFLGLTKDAQYNYLMGSYCVFLAKSKEIVD